MEWQALAQSPGIRPLLGDRPVESCEQLYAMLAERAPHMVEHAEEYRANEEQHGAASLYDWNVKNYGTKWDIDVQEGDVTQTDLGDDTVLIEMHYESAWAPPLAAMRTISAMYPTLELTCEYAEMGSDFEGRLVLKGGVELSFEEGTYGEFGIGILTEDEEDEEGEEESD